jgi:hypothetical protein
MNKAFITFLCFATLLTSCSKNKNSQRKYSGDINSVSIIIDDNLWSGEVGDSMRNKFASPVLGLPQEEPLFTINQYPTKLLEGFMRDRRNIIIIKRTSESKFEYKINQYTTPQNVFHISGKTSDDILCNIEEHAPEMIRIIKETEILVNQKAFDKSLLDPKIIENKFHVSLKIPSNYLYVLHKNRFIWLKKEIISGSSSLIIYQVPLWNSKTNANIISSIIKMRDSISRLYIHGRERNNQMITEKAYAPYFFKIILDGKRAYETKGTWQLKNNFMSGPFINYVIADKKYHRMLVIEAFCYSPSEDKRDIMLELESIIKSVKISKKKLFFNKYKKK